MKIFKTSSLVIFVLVLIGWRLPKVKAQDYTSASFILRDPVISIESGVATSTSFQYFSSSGQTVTGASTSSAFIYHSSFLFFPVATSPVLTAATGNNQVSLNWTAAAATLANITNYELGTATTSGGPYTFESVGNVLAFTKTGLTNGTTYYFIIRALASGQLLSKSGEVSSVPVAPAPPPPPPPPPSGGGGGGGYVPPPAATAAVNFTGRAYPLSKATLLKDGQVAVTTVAGPDANFQISLTGLSAGSYIFTIYTEDGKGRRSALFSFPVTLTAGATTSVGGIFLAPTIDVDKSKVRRGENIAIFGQSVPEAEITIEVNSDEPVFLKTPTDKNGTYLYNFDTTPLDIGDHLAKSKTALKGEISSFSLGASFAVSTVSVPKKVPRCGKADLNCDGKVNLVDFSIAAYWYKRPLSPAFAAIEKERLSGDGKVTLVDFSIMAYYWTG